MKAGIFRMARLVASGAVFFAAALCSCTTWFEGNPFNAHSSSDGQRLYSHEIHPVVNNNNNDNKNLPAEYGQLRFKTSTDLNTQAKFIISSSYDLSFTVARDSRFSDVIVSYPSSDPKFFAGTDSVVYVLITNLTGQVISYNNLSESMRGVCIAPESLMWTKVSEDSSAWSEYARSLFSTGFLKPLQESGS